MLIGSIATGLLSIGSVCSAFEYVWTQKADMPTARWSPTSAVVNGKIYVIGGGESEPGEGVYSTVEEYDPATDTWTPKANMPTARGWTSPSSAVVDGRIYVIGGWNDGSKTISTVEEYDPATDTWARKADMPTRRTDLGTCTVNGKIYAIGGYPPAGYRGLTTVELYDPGIDTWTKKADMPLAAGMLNACVVSGKIYAIGGRPDLKSRAYVQEYDPATDTWTQKADMPVATSQMVSVVLGNKIIVIGGWLWSLDSPYRTVQMYDPEADTWTIEADTPFLRAAFTAEVVNNRIYAIGGTDRPHPCPATSTVYELTINPAINPAPPDLNGDGIIDVKDIAIMTHYWGSRYSLCDIGPTPLGDGIVDVWDLLVLAEYIEPEEIEPGLVAHWKLDETDGSSAYDSVSGEEDALAIGDPLWQPTAGMVDGALELDGIDDCVVTGFVLNPAKGPFSVLAWVKGGAPGQVIISEHAAANWVMADAEGCLMTQLKAQGRPAGAPLPSQAVITDGNWHRIALAWDGSRRSLYVDGVVAAEDTQSALPSSGDSLYIGTGKGMEPGTFFSGLIDDVRIYNRAVSP